MYVLIYLILFGLITFIFNKINEVESDSNFLKWRKQDLLIIAGLLGLAIILQILDFIIPQIIGLSIYTFITIMAIVYVNKNREKYIQEYKTQLEQIYEAISPLQSEKNEELDYSNLPFQVTKKHNKINTITLEMKNPKKYNDSNCTNVVYSLKNYFPYYDWQYTNDYPKQTCIFQGQELPPSIANWPGSNHRPAEYMPVGVAGDGEVGINIGYKNPGKSSYIYENTGKPAGDVQLPSSPQILTVGSTGGGKAIWDEQEIW